MASNLLMLHRLVMVTTFAHCWCEVLLVSYVPFPMMAIQSYALGTKVENVVPVLDLAEKFPAIRDMVKSQVGKMVHDCATLKMDLVALSLLTVEVVEILDAVAVIDGYRHLNDFQLNHKIVCALIAM